MTYTDEEDEVFLGRSVTQHKHVSGRDRARSTKSCAESSTVPTGARRKILVTQNDKLEAMAQALLRYETIDREQIAAIMDGREPKARAKDWQGGERPATLFNNGGTPRSEHRSAVRRAVAPKRCANASIHSAADGGAFDPHRPFMSGPQKDLVVSAKAGITFDVSSTGSVTERIPAVMGTTLAEVEAWSIQRRQVRPDQRREPLDECGGEPA